MARRSVSTLVCADTFSHSYNVCISSNGWVYSFGNQEKGSHGHKEQIIIPTRIPSLKNIIGIDCGYKHTICLDVNGNVYTFGCNESGELGVGIGRQELPFTHEIQKVNLPPIKQVRCGDNFSLCVSEEGNVYSFGSNNIGQLGLNGTENRNFPHKIESLDNIEFVECGNSFTICKTLNNEVYSWGYNHYGQLSCSKSYIFTPCKYHEWPEDIVDIKCGYSHILVLTSTQEVYSSGNNDNGQLGRATIYKYSNTLQKVEVLSDIIQIECGEHHSLCIDMNHNLIVFGLNSLGQLGLGDNDNRNTPIKHPSLSNIIDVSSRGLHTFIKTSCNEVYAFGRNIYSQLGIKTEDDNQITPIRVFEDNEDIWFSNINKSKAKSARF